MLILKLILTGESQVPILNRQPAIETIKQNILDQLLSGKKTFQLVMHQNPDADAIGSALAMKELIEALVPDSNVKIFVEEHLPEVRQMIADNQSAFGVLSEDASVIALDVSALAMVNMPAVEYNTDQMIVIDHHHLGQEEPPLGVLAGLNLTVPDRAAGAVLVYELYQKAGITPSLEAAKALYVAIYKDSGGFRYEEYNNSQESQQMVSELTDILTDNIGAAGLRDLLKSVDSPPLTPAEQIEWNQVLDNYTLDYQTADGHQVVFSVIPRGFDIAQRYRDLGHNLQSYAINDLKQQESETLSYLQADHPLLEKRPLVVVAVAKKDGIKFSIRTTGAAQKSALYILELIGGGGHQQAAGGFISYSELDQKLPILLEQIGLSHSQFNSILIENKI